MKRGAFFSLVDWFLAIPTWWWPQSSGLIQYKVVNECFHGRRLVAYPGFFSRMCSLRRLSFHQWCMVRRWTVLPSWTKMIFRRRSNKIVKAWCDFRRIWQAFQFRAQASSSSLPCDVLLLHLDVIFVSFFIFQIFVDNLFNLFDEDGDGFIDQDEFLQPFYQQLT